MGDMRDPDFRYPEIEDGDSDNLILAKGIVRGVQSQSRLKDADHTLIYNEGGSSKFYQLKIVGDCMLYCYGKIGSSGNIYQVQYKDKTAAMIDMNLTLRAKLKKGYIEPIPPELEVKIANKKTHPSKLAKSMSKEHKDKFDGFLNKLTL